MVMKTITLARLLVTTASILRPSMPPTVLSAARAGMGLHVDTTAYVF